MELFLMLSNIKNIIEFVIIILKGLLVIIFRNLLLTVINNIDYKILFLINYTLYYEKEDTFLVDDESDSSKSNSDDDVYENSIYDMIKFNCNINKTINKNKMNPDKYGVLNKNEYYIINSFLFNVTGNNYKVTNKHRFTKKLIILYYLDGFFNMKSIKDLMPNSIKYQYLYIFYKTDKNEYKIIIIDLNNNYEIINDKSILFNKLIL